MANDEEGDDGEDEAVPVDMELVATTLRYGPRWVDLSCGHDFTWDQPLRDGFAPLDAPTRLGDMVVCFKCNQREMVWGIAFNDTSGPAFQAMRDAVQLLVED